MTDEQTARQFMKILPILRKADIDVDVLAETFNQIRIEERARCVAIVESYATGYHLPAVQIAARGILAEIQEE